MPEAALVSFVKALTDDRVRFERVPFDHPELCVSAGAAEGTADLQHPLSATDKWLAFPPWDGTAIPV